jgi:hypothetical protein
MSNYFHMDLINGNSIYTGQSTFSLDASGDKVGWVVAAPDAVVVDRIAVCFDAKTGTPPTYAYSLYDISTNGTPGSTILGATANATATHAPTAISNDTFHELTLGESVSFSAGDKFAIVIEYSSGTINASNFASYQYGFSGLTTNYDYGIGYGLTKTGSWTRQTASTPSVLFGDGTNWYGVPFSNVRTTRAFNTGSSPSEYGLKFTAPAFGSLSFYKLRGVRLALAPSLSGNSQSVNLNLYAGGAAGDTTQTQTVALDTDNFLSSSFSPKDLLFTGTAPTLTVGSTYRISWSASSANSHSSYTLPLSSANHVTALGFGSTFCRTDRAGGNWTDTTTEVPLVYGLIIEDLAGGTTNIVNFSRGRGASFGKGRW